MSEKEIKVKVKVMEGQKCIVQNYNRKHKEENGECTSVSVGIRPDGKYHVSYRVILERRTTGRSRMFREGGAPIFLTVGDDAIELIK